jgi:hypothetical protein
MRQIPGRTCGLELSKGGCRSLRGGLAGEDATSKCALLESVRGYLYTSLSTRP